MIYLFQEKEAGQRPYCDVDHSFRVDWQTDKLEEASKRLTAVIQETMAQRG